MSALKLYDLSNLATNGLKRGRTTGSCAAAAAKAAMLFLYDGVTVQAVAVTLPDQEHFLPVPVDQVEATENGARAAVIKFAGDDPDQTDGATIFAEIKVNNRGELNFHAGPGVGTVTAPGIRVPVGQPAINPGPREMIKLAIEEVLDGRPDPGFDITIGCLRGEEIAKRTFNLRLGIVGGISILGTTGIVEPMSLAAYKAAIEVYIRVALAQPVDLINAGEECAAYLPGNLGLSLAKGKLNLGQRQIVHISNFIGYAFEATQSFLEEEARTFESIWLLGHPGKIAKILDGHWDTHSQRSPMALATLAKIAEEIDLSQESIKAIAQANTAEAIVGNIDSADEMALWTAVSKRVAVAAKALMPRVRLVQVQLFDMSGRVLGEVGRA